MMLRRCCLLVLFAFFVGVATAQTIDEILLHFVGNEMEVPYDIRSRMVYNKGNTLQNYDGYHLKIYDKRSRFIQITTPTERTYEIAFWKLDKKNTLVALCETRGGDSKQSLLRFFLPQEEWREVPVEEYLPEFSLEDIFSVKKLEKNYLTIQTLLPDMQVKTQFFLPQSGHDIIVVFTCLDELDKKEFKRIYRYLDGTMLDMIWNKGKFEKGPAYFLVN